jgi:hypothetical protein
MLIAALTLTACETANMAAGGVDPNYTPLVMVRRDAGFRLTEVQRQQVRPGFDLDALERLLAHVPAERRDSLFVAFSAPQGNEVRELWYLGDPALQELLEQVWAPVWDRVPLSVIEADKSERPGKRLAIERRRARP